jgi:hypothetical protein
MKKVVIRGDNVHELISKIPKQLKQIATHNNQKF